MRKETILIITMAAIKFVLPFLLQNPAYELHRDEYLYYQQGQHLSFGFLENPPLIGLMAWISSLLGGSFFWIKFWPCLFGALTLIVTAGIVKELGGSLFALVLSALGILLTGYLRVHFLFQPNFLDIFFWTLSAYYLLRFINTEKNKYLYLLSIALAFGWWGKYSVLFFATAIVLSILLTYHRKVFLNKHFWLAILVGMVLIFPNLYWQYQHRWPLVHHMQELRETQLRYLNKADFIKEQILMLLPLVFVWIGGLIWLLNQKKYRIIGFVYLACALLIMLGSGKGYYTLGTYPMLLAAGSVWLEKWSINRAWLRYGIVILILVLLVPFLPLIMPLQEPHEMALTNEKYNLKEAGILRWEDLENHALQQDFADMIGWRELAQKTEKFYRSLSPEDQSKAIVYCRHYGQAGALRYYAKDAEFKNKIICDNGTFLLWIPELHFKHLIFVGRNIPESDDEVFQQFEKRTVVDSVTNRLSRQYRDKIILFENAKDSAWQLANKGIKEMKAEFGE